MYWPAIIPLRNCFVHPIVLSRLVLQADKIFMDPLACWQESFSAHTILWPVPLTFAVVVGAAHPMPPSQQGQQQEEGAPFLLEPRFCWSPVLPHPVGARSGHRRAGGRQPGSGRAVPGATAAAGTEPAERPRPCSVPASPRLRGPGAARPLPHRKFAFACSILWQTKVSPGRSKYFMRGREDVGMRRVETGSIDAQKPPEEKKKKSIKKDALSLVKSLKDLRVHRVVGFFFRVF